MALDDIKKAILTEAEKQADQIKVSGKKQVKEIKEFWQKKVDNKVEEIVAATQKKADQKLQQTHFRLKASSQTLILKKKQKVIDKVYDLVLDKLKDMPEKDYVAFMEKLIEALPDINGEVISVKGKATLLDKIMDQAKRQIKLSKKTAPGRGGFIFISQSMDIENTFETLVANIKEETILDVTKIIFSNSSD